MNPIPTPTPYAYVVTERITALDAGDWSIWNFADDAINIWNYYPPLGDVIQVAVVFILTIVFVMLLIKEFQRLRGKS